MTTLDYRPVHTDAERQALADIQALCFGGTSAEALEWHDRFLHGNERVVVDGAHVAGGELLIRMGQCFGGRRVPMVGICGVGIDPGDRADGAATHLMRETVKELHAEGTALSTLFPAVQPLYRRAGYEQAGSHFRVAMATERLFLQDRTLSLRRATATDEEAITALHQEHVRENDGNVERDATMWAHVHAQDKAPVHGFVVEGESGLEGYVYYESWGNPSGHQDLVVKDVVARTPASARRLLTFFRDHRSLVDTVRWRGHPADPLLLQAQEQRHQVRLWDTWMVRITHLESALTQRGYPQGVAAEIHLDLEDDLLPDQAGPWVLRVEAGTATLERGGEGRVACDVRALAPLYTGFVSPWQWRHAFDVTCSDADARGLGALFAGPHPWIQVGF